MSPALEVTALAGTLDPSSRHSPRSQFFTPATCTTTPSQGSRCRPNVSSPDQDSKTLHMTGSALPDRKVRCRAARAYQLSSSQRAMSSSTRVRGPRGISGQMPIDPRAAEQGDRLPRRPVPAEGRGQRGQPGGIERGRVVPVVPDPVPPENRTDSTARPRSGRLALRRGSYVDHHVAVLVVGLRPVIDGSVPGALACQESAGGSPHHVKLGGGYAGH